MLLSDHPTDAALAALLQKYRPAVSEPIMSQGEWNLVKRACQ